MKLFLIIVVTLTALAASQTPLTIKYLAQPVTVEDLARVMDTNQLLIHSPPGTFLQPLFTIYPLPSKDMIYLLLSTQLLETMAWHYNVMEQYGDITSYTYSYPTLEAGLNVTWQMAEKYNVSLIDQMPEIVMHYPISFNQIIGIATSSKETYFLLLRQLPTQLLPYTYHVPENFLVGMLNISDIAEPLPEQMPDFCFTLYESYPGMVDALPLAFYQKYAANCGWTDEQIQRYHNTSRLVASVKRAHPLKHGVKFWPPYSY